MYSHLTKILQPDSLLIFSSLIKGVLPIEPINPFRTALDQSATPFEIILFVFVLFKRIFPFLLNILILNRNKLKIESYSQNYKAN